MLKSPSVSDILELEDHKVQSNAFLEHSKWSPAPFLTTFTSKKDYFLKGVRLDSHPLDYQQTCRALDKSKKCS